MSELSLSVLACLLLPLIGTTAGSSSVFFFTHALSKKVHIVLSGFAAGIMVAASIWSLLIPALEMGDTLISVLVGFWLGVGFLLLLDNVVPHQHTTQKQAEGPSVHFKKSTMLSLAVTLHNIPEGMAVGVVIAGWLTGEAGLSAMAALVLALGIAIQNVPEGAIISLPLYAAGETRKKAFVEGFLSGAVEPLAAIITACLAELVVSVLPCLLAASAGAMLYVVVDELIPATDDALHANAGIIAFALGFSLMLFLDVVLG